MPNKFNRKQDPRKKQSAPQTRIEKSNKEIGKHPKGSQPYTAAHHHRHDYVGFQVKEVPERAEVLFIAFDTLDMLSCHFVEHCAEQQKNNCRQDYGIPKYFNYQIGQNSKPCNVKACDHPYDPRY